MASPAVEVCVSRRMDERAYLFYDPETMTGALVDPDIGSETLVRRAEELGVSVRYILLTHGHFDHTGGLKAVAEKTGAPVCISAADAPMLEDARLSLAVLAGDGEARVPARCMPGEGDVLELGALTVRVLATPGHTPGCLCYLCGDALFSGDTIFSNTVGATHFPGGDARTLLQSVDRLMQLPDSVTVYPGHGPAAPLPEVRDALTALRWYI